ncbi:CaiB/BaiF CoA transferase family protein [Halomicroarcula sp. GCM10025817]|uniref:CaiB/BaiF CoA transferase family protein n=1 Tax=Haloarcula TaxID=2237 RepID=UPI0023E84AB2|nr:CoA transferase [Halomicroarcula sp. SYNS111]
MSAALEDVTVVTFGQIVQVPYATQILGELGADVVKIERPGGEWSRHWSLANEYLDGESILNLVFNRNKRSIELDLKDDVHRDVAYDLVEEADVVVENFRPGVMDRLGFGYEELSEAKPDLIYCSASGYGSTGPYADRPGQDLLIQAMSGMMSLTGRRDDPPTPQATSMIDIHSATYLVVAILAALHYRERTGHGQKIEGDLLSASIDLQTQELGVLENTDEPAERSATGVGHVHHPAPYGVYETADGYLALSLSMPAEIGEILDDEALEAVTTWQEAYDRRDEIKPLIEAQLEDRSTEHWLDTFLEHDIWCAPVNETSDMGSDPQVEANDMLQSVAHPTGGEFTTTGFPVRLSESPGSVRRRPPTAGEHTEEILEELGYDPDDVLGDD